MRRYYQWSENGVFDPTELNRQTAFHEAGHAAAIYLENRRKNLPPVYFQIHTHKHKNSERQLSAKVKGGRLIDNLAAVNRDELSGAADFCYQQAYEADIINFLAGPLAEARYTAIRDNEAFSIDLLTPYALQHYGGNTDLQEALSYLAFFVPNAEQRQSRLNTLFAQAFCFIQQRDNWHRISALAHFILDHADAGISCEQASEVLDRHYPYANIRWL